MKCNLVAIILLSVVFGKTSYAYENVTQVGRYSTISNKPMHFQIDLLSQTIQVCFTRNIKTVGDAINYLLRFSGYSLIQESKMSSALKNILEKPLPIIDHELGPLALSDALQTLVGPAFVLKQDPVNRVVDFKLKSEYLRFVNKDQ